MREAQKKNGGVTKNKTEWSKKKIQETTRKGEDTDASKKLGGKKTSS